MVAPPLDGQPTPGLALHASVYEELRRRILTGKIMPGVSLSTRGLAAELGISQMPVRDALSRLAADGAIAIRSKRRIEVPEMTIERFTDLLDCRLLLEPAAAAFALCHIGPVLLRELRASDEALDRAIAAGDPIAYMEANHAFHFGIYRANERPTLNRAIEALWLQFGPFMRLVYGRYGTSGLIDQHAVALDAIAANDPNALSAAIAADIVDGMGLLGRASFPATALGAPDWPHRARS